MLEFLRVKAGNYKIGADKLDIEQATSYWQSRLLENFSREQFEEWLYKEFPAFTTPVKEFFLSRTLVTNAMYSKFVESTGIPPCESLLVDSAEHPAWGMSFDQARGYCRWLTASNPQYSYRLPREIEWEAAARGPEGLEFPYGREFDPSKANTVESGIGSTTPVERYSCAPGPFGHLDLAGNVEEWVDDRYWVYPGGKLICDDLYAVFGMEYHILRGGSFIRGGDLSRGARRHGRYPKPEYRFTGFRVVREIATCV